MRVRIVKQPSGTVDGIDLTKFVQGATYDMGTSLATLLLVSKWAEPVIDEEPALVVPLDHPDVKRLMVLQPDTSTADERAERRRRPRRR